MFQQLSMNYFHSHHSIEDLFQEIWILICWIWISISISMQIIPHYFYGILVCIAYIRLQILTYKMQLLFNGNVWVAFRQFYVLQLGEGVDFHHKYCVVFCLDWLLSFNYFIIFSLLSAQHRLEWQHQVSQY